MDVSEFLHHQQLLLIVKSLEGKRVLYNELTVYSFACSSILTLCQVKSLNFELSGRKHNFHSLGSIAILILSTFVRQSECIVYDSTTRNVVCFGEGGE